jgi:hypothetical protein
MASKTTTIARYRLTNTFVGDFTRQLCPACRDKERRFGMKVTRLKSWRSDGTGCDNCLCK